MSDTAQRSRRSAQEVFDDHLACRRAGDLEADLARNYADDVVVLTGAGVFRGKDGVRHVAGILLCRLPCICYEYRTKVVDGDIAFLEWSAHCATARVEDGADSFWIRDGHIVAQTIHYTVQPTAGT